MIADARMRHFLCLDQAAQQAAAIRRLHATSHSEFGIASATGLSVEQVRSVLRDTSIRDAVARPINSTLRIP
jgi:DNA invertase Pin-like site-specific DNA recombinase